MHISDLAGRLFIVQMLVRIVILAGAHVDTTAVPRGFPGVQTLSISVYDPFGVQVEDPLLSSEIIIAIPHVNLSAFHVPVFCVEANTAGPSVVNDNKVVVSAVAAAEVFG